MTTFVTDAHQAVVTAIELEEGRMAPKKRLAVLAALDCFAEHGFDGTSTKMIAQKASIGEATIFRHFPSKKALLERMVLPVVRHILTPEAGRQAQELQKYFENDPRKILREVMLSRLHFMTTYEPLVRIVVQECLVNPELRTKIQREVGPFFEVLAKVVALVGPEAASDKTRFFRTIGSLMGGYFIHKSIIAPGGDWDDEVEVEYLLTILFDGIGATTRS